MLARRRFRSGFSYELRRRTAVGTAEIQSFSSSIDQIPSNGLKEPRKVLVGLGNPTEKYVDTRHNIGKRALTHFLKSHVSSSVNRSLQMLHDPSVHGDVIQAAIGYTAEDSAGYDLVDFFSERSRAKTAATGVPHPTVQLTLLAPTTYMNASGKSVRGFLSHHRWRLKRNPLSLNFQDEMLVLSDEVSLPFGTIRLKSRGSSGGQNGVKDVIQCVGTDRFARLKIGVGASQWFTNGNTGPPSHFPLDKYVLSRFNSSEQDRLGDLLKYIQEVLRVYLHRGLQQATTVANGMDLDAYLHKFADKKAVV
uniref:PeptidyltRNA hydrolase putative n=1 Tax=Albugo laibachii Nc14 TaxID=890382 RepID=F0W5M8_9STRA|nr:peptidyltRNA hydrolase putative [Albugo laibachii Nc14]|eukprot:CCA16419.1 peptidyltRNA hydrolase putative [Albugo laibachii Nc14]